MAVALTLAAAALVPAVHAHGHEESHIPEGHAISDDPIVRRDRVSLFSINRHETATEKL